MLGYQSQLNEQDLSALARETFPGCSVDLRGSDCDQFLQTRILGSFIFAAKIHTRALLNLSFAKDEFKIDLWEIETRAIRLKNTEQRKEDTGLNSSETTISSAEETGILGRVSPFGENGNLEILPRNRTFLANTGAAGKIVASFVFLIWLASAFALYSLYSLYSMEDKGLAYTFGSLVLGIPLAFLYGRKISQEKEDAANATIRKILGSEKGIGETLVVRGQADDSRSRDLLNLFLELRKASPNLNFSFSWKGNALYFFIPDQGLLGRGKVFPSQEMRLSMAKDSFRKISAFINSLSSSLRKKSSLLPKGRR